MLRTPFTAMLVLLATLVLTGCLDATRQETAGAATVKDDSPAATPSTMPTPADPGVATEPAPLDGAGAAEPASEPPTRVWQVANVSLGLSIDEARRRLPIHDCIPVEDSWATEDYTGILTAGTYEDPVGRVLSVVCFEGKVVGVVDSVRETEEDFSTRFQGLLNEFGQSSGKTPDFAEGRQFIYEMIHADPSPDHQYMWANNEAQSMYFAAHFTETYISNYVLIDAAHYDYAAAAMAQR